jgi:hypothetical protein
VTGRTGPERGFELAGPRGFLAAGRPVPALRIHRSWVDEPGSGEAGEAEPEDWWCADVPLGESGIVLMLFVYAESGGTPWGELVWPALEERTGLGVWFRREDDRLVATVGRGPAGFLGELLTGYRPSWETAEGFLRGLAELVRLPVEVAGDGGGAGGPGRGRAI